jgi:hypothetical protein
VATKKRIVANLLKLAANIRSSTAKLLNMAKIARKNGFARLIDEEHLNDNQEHQEPLRRIPGTYTVLLGLGGEMSARLQILAP